MNTAIRIWLLASAGALLFCSVAQADGCTYDPATKKVAYTYSEAFTVRALGPAPDGAISIAPTGSPAVACQDAVSGSSATVANTDTIEITRASLSVFSDAMTLDLTYPLAPGYTSEGNSSGEIEFTFTSPAVSYTRIEGGPGDDFVRVGDDGVNLNANEPEGVDADIPFDQRGSDAGSGQSSVDMFGHAGNDFLSNAGGAGTGTETSPEQFGRILDGGPGDDRLYQSGDQSVVRGGPGGDLLVGDEVEDDAQTTALFDDSTGTITVDLSIPGRQSIGGGLGSDRLVAIQKVIGGDFADSLKGADGKQNELFGAKGDDSLVGGSSFNILHGGEDNDQLTGNSTADHLFGEDGSDTLTGGGGDDYVAGDQPEQSGADTLNGGPGEDLLTGGAGPDALDAGPGDDTLNPGGGEADTIVGGDGKDQLLFSPPAASDGPKSGILLDLQVQTAQQTGGGGLDTVTTIEDVRGTRFSDELFGTDGSNVLSNEGTNSQVRAAGSDHFAGRGGDDRLETFGRDTDRTVLEGGAGDDELLSGSGPDELYGDAGDDVLSSAFGDDYLEGGSGEDRLLADWGDDELIADDGEYDELDCGSRDQDNDIVAFDDGLDFLAANCEVEEEPTPDQDPGPNPNPDPNPPGGGPPQGVAGSPVTGSQPPAAGSKGSQGLAAFRVGDVIKLPSNRTGHKRCSRGRTIKVKVREPAGVQISEVAILVNGKQVPSSGGAWRKGVQVRLSLRKRVRIKVRVKAADGRVVTASRTYRSCR